jgi:hypothetical protein
VIGLAAGSVLTRVGGIQSYGDNPPEVARESAKIPSATRSSPSNLILGWWTREPGRGMVRQKGGREQQCSTKEVSTGTARVQFAGSGPACGSKILARQFLIGSFGFNEVLTLRETGNHALQLICRTGIRLGISKITSSLWRSDREILSIRTIMPAAANDVTNG